MIFLKFDFRCYDKYVDFGKLLRKYRKEKSVTQKTLATLVGVDSQAYIALLENSQTQPPTFDICKKLVNVLEVPTLEQEEFYSSALHERLSEDAKKYHEHLGVSFSDSKQIRRSVASIMVPLLKEVPRFKDEISELKKVKNIELDHSLASSGSFGIVYFESWGIMDHFGILPGDIVIIDPEAEISQNTPILANIEGAPRLYRYEQIENIFLFQACINGVKNYTFTLKDLQKVHIIGKVVTVIKKF